MRRYALIVVFALFGGCGEERHGFIKISANALFGDSDRLECGEAKIAPNAGGLLDAFVTLKPQDCTLTFYRSGDFLGFGTKLCKLHIENNKIASVYLTESQGTLSCNLGNS